MTDGMPIVAARQRTSAWLARLTILCLVVLVPACGSERVTTSPVVGQSQREVHIFYYPWYGNPQIDGEWVHWTHGCSCPHSNRLHHNPKEKRPDRFSPDPARLPTAP